MSIEIGSWGEGEQVRVERKEAYFTSATYFHTHRYYEINLILNGNFRILLGDRAEKGEGCTMVLAPPGVAHYVSCVPDKLYKRRYLLFSTDFIKNYVPQWKYLISVFGEEGRILHLTDAQKEKCAKIIEEIDEEKDIFRQRLLTLYLLSCVADFEDMNTELYKSPSYIVEALTYISEHYGEKIVAAKLSEKLGVSRTTLFKAFKKYTGSTFNFYILDMRFKKAIGMMQEGKSMQEVSESCGFGDSSAFSRSFKKRFGMSPRQYFSNN